VNLSQVHVCKKPPKNLKLCEQLSLTSNPTTFNQKPKLGPCNCEIFSNVFYTALSRAVPFVTVLAGTAYLHLFQATKNSNC